VGSFRYDLVVVGAGSGGYAAARTARELGASVALVDHGPLGGLCILRGCMPSKTLLATSDLMRRVRAAGGLAITAGEPRVDLAELFARKRKIVAAFADYRIEGIHSFPLYEGRATFQSDRVLRVGEDVTLEAKSFVIATGSVVAPAAVTGLAETGYIDSDAVLDSEHLPSSVVVLGGGDVGCELGQFLARLGVRTTFLIRAPHLLSREDADVGGALTAAFRDEGIDVRTGAQLSHVEVVDGQKVVHYIRDGRRERIAAREIFYALGRLPNVEGLGLENAGVTFHPMTGVDVGPDLRTRVPHIFAVGDVTGQFPLVHVAIYQGEIAARNAVKGTSEVADYALQKAHAIFTDPQVAIAGRTEKELRTSAIPYVAASHPFDDHGKAIAIDETKGFVKMLASPVDGTILGAAIVGAHASDLIHEAIVAMHYRGTVFDFLRIPHLHPTMAEILTYPAEEIAAQLSADAARAEAV